MQQIEIWLAILFLSRKKFHAKQIFVLSSSMKLGPDLIIQCHNVNNITEYLNKVLKAHNDCNL